MNDGELDMGEESSFNLWYSIKFWIYRLYWFIVGGRSIYVPLKEMLLVVDHDHPMWYDVGARRVEILTDNPVHVYGPWLRENVGQMNVDWHMIIHQDTVEQQHMVVQGNPEVEIQFRKGKGMWADVAALKWI